MPELLVYPSDPQILNDIEAGERALRKTEIEKHKQYYIGDQKKPLKVRPNQPDDNVIINLTNRVIDQSVSMLVGDAPEYSIQDEVKQIIIDALWDANEKQDFTHGVAISGSLAGHVFVKLARFDSDMVRFINLPAEYVTVFWKPDDIRQVVCYKVEWTQGKTSRREDIYRVSDNAWAIQPYTREEGGAWKRGDEIIWNQSFAPIVDWQNLPDNQSYYGQSDLINIDINDAVNFVASNINRILKFHAHPRTIGIGVRKGEIEETAVDGFWSVLNQDAKISNLEMQSDLGSSMVFLDYLQSAFYSQHRAVDLASMKDRIGQLTNFGLRMLFKDALDKTRVKQTLYGEGFEYLVKRAGAIMGYDFEGVEIRWSDPLPFNDTEEITGLEKELSLGIVSKQTAAEIRGRNWKMEQERMAQEKADAGMGIGQAFADALKKFDAGGQSVDETGDINDG